jgi:hypothetical protein
MQNEHHWQAPPVAWPGRQAGLSARRCRHSAGASAASAKIVRKPRIGQDDPRQDPAECIDPQPTAVPSLPVLFAEPIPSSIPQFQLLCWPLSCIRGRDGKIRSAKDCTSPSTCQPVFPSTSAPRHILIKSHARPQPLAHSIQGATQGTNTGFTALIRPRTPPRRHPHHIRSRKVSPLTTTRRAVTKSRLDQPTRTSQKGYFVPFFKQRSQPFPTLLPLCKVRHAACAKNTPWTQLPREG